MKMLKIFSAVLKTVWSYIIYPKRNCSYSIFFVDIQQRWPPLDSSMPPACPLKKQPRRSPPAATARGPGQVRWFSAHYL